MITGQTYDEVNLERCELKDINLLDVGNTIQISGVIYSSAEIDYLCFLPDATNDGRLVYLDMNLEDWEKFFRQTDLMETEILAQDKTGKLVKVIARKSERQIDQMLSWKVYQRDDYSCRYCGKTATPLTVDHVILWEEGGPSIPANLLTSCRACNKTRGSMSYKDWLKSSYYNSVSVNIPPEVRIQNDAVLANLPNIPKRIHRKSR